MYFHCVGGGFGGKGAASLRLAVSASVAAFKSVLTHTTQKLRSHFCSLLMKSDLNVCLSCCLGGAAVRRQTCDRKIAGSTPRRGAIKPTRSTQPSIPPG